MRRNEMNSHELVTLVWDEYPDSVQYPEIKDPIARSLNLTANVKLSTYKVKAIDEYTSFTDVRKIEHRQVLGRRISGSFSLIFDSMKSHTIMSPSVGDPVRICGYEEFIDALEKARNPIDGSYNVRMYLNNTNKIAFNEPVVLDYVLPDDAPLIIAGGLSSEININVDGLSYIDDTLGESNVV